MQLFSEDYLTHYGVKGMKWHKHKATRNTDVDLITDFHETPGTPEPFDPGVYSISDHPEAYIDAAYNIVTGSSFNRYDAPSVYALSDAKEADKLRADINKRHRATKLEDMKTPEGRRRQKVIRAVADELRRRDEPYYEAQRQKAYRKREIKVARQQRKNKIKKQVSNTKNRVANTISKIRRKKKS